MTARAQTPPAIVATLASDTARLGFGATRALRDGLPLVGGALQTDRAWFGWLVVLPTSVMLLGGYLIGRGYRAGSVLAWWTPLFAARPLRSTGWRGPRVVTRPTRPTAITPSPSGRGSGTQVLPHLLGHHPVSGAFVEPQRPRVAAEDVEFEPAHPM